MLSRPTISNKYNALTVLVCLGLYSTAATAAPSKTGNLHRRLYARADILYSFPANNFLQGHKFKAAPGLNVGAGYIFNSYFRSDITASYRGMYKHSSTSATFKASNIAFMLNGYLSAPSFRFGRLSPYLAAGAGFSVNKLGNTSISNSVTYGASSAAFAWQLGTGVLYQLANNFKADFFYKYANLGRIETSSSSIIAGKDVVAPSTKGRIRTHEISLGLTFNLTR